MPDRRPTGWVRPGPNDILPCPSDSARRRHWAKGEACETCGTDRTEPSNEEEARNG